MALPKQVQKQMAEVERISKEITDGQQPETQEEVQDETQEEAGQEGTQPKPVEQGGQPDDWEHKYKVLQGKYNAEAARNNERIQQLEDMLSRLDQKLSAPKERPAEPAAPKNYSYVKPEEIDDFGEDMMDVVGRRAKEVLEPLLDKLSKRIQALEGQVSGVNERVTLTAREQLLKDLAGEVPNWEELNRNSEFLEWLSQEEGLSGMPRRQLLTEAYERNDTARVVKFFKGFLREHTGDDGSSSQTEPKSKAQVPVKTLVAPTRGRGGDSGTPEGKRIWKTAEVAAFYDAVRKGKYRSNPDKQRQIEAEIVAAGREGRIQ